MIFFIFLSPAEKNYPLFTNLKIDSGYLDEYRKTVVELYTL